MNWYLQPVDLISVFVFLLAYIFWSCILCIQLHSYLKLIVKIVKSQLFLLVDENVVQEEQITIVEQSVESSGKTTTT